MHEKKEEIQQTSVNTRRLVWLTLPRQCVYVSCKTNKSDPIHENFSRDDADFDRQNTRRKKKREWKAMSDDSDGNFPPFSSQLCFLFFIHHTFSSLFRSISSAFNHEWLSFV